MDAALPARLQFAATILSHFLLPAITIGLALLIAFVETARWPPVSSLDERFPGRPGRVPGPGPNRRGELSSVRLACLVFRRAQKLESWTRRARGASVVRFAITASG